MHLTTPSDGQALGPRLAPRACLSIANTTRRCTDGDTADTGSQPMFHRHFPRAGAALAYAAVHGRPSLSNFFSHRAIRFAQSPFQPWRIASFDNLMASS